MAEPQTRLCELIELRCPVALRAIEPAEFCAEGFTGNQYDIELAEAVGPGVEFAVQPAFGKPREASAALAKFLCEQGQVLIGCSRRVVRVVVDLAGAQRPEE